MAVNTPTDRIAADIVTHLAGRFSDETYTVERTDNPRLERDATDALKIQVIPYEETEEKRCRGFRHLERNTVNLLITAGITATATSTHLRGFGYRCRRALRNVKMAGYTLSTIEPATLYDVETVRTRDHFVALHRLTYLGVTELELADLSVTTATLAAAAIGQAYYATLAAAGGSPPYTWSLAAGSLPAGLSLDPDAGVISGTPTENAGSPYSLTLQVTDDAGDTAQAVVSLTVHPAAPVALFDDTPFETDYGVAVAFTDLSTGIIDSWLWRFGDGETSTDQHPTHVYDEIGTYTVSLTVYGPAESDTYQVDDLVSVVEPDPDPDPFVPLQLVQLTMEELDDMSWEQLDRLEWGDYQPLPAPSPTADGVLHSSVYRAIGTGTGLYTGAQKLFYDAVLAGTYNADELDTFEYVMAPRAQMADATIRNGDKALWDTLKTYFEANSTSGAHPKRLLTVRQNAFQYNNYGIDIWTDANTVGPVWDLPTIVAPSGEIVPRPTASEVEQPYASTNDPANQLTFAQCKAILDAAGFSWANYGLNPLGDTFPREFDRLGAVGPKHYRLRDCVMRCNNAVWIDRLSDLIVACLNDETTLGDLDGVVITTPKIQLSYTPYYGSPGIRADGTKGGTGTRKLRYWTKHRAEGSDPQPPASAWSITNNDPVWGQGSHTFDDPYHTTSYEYLEGWLALLQACVTKLAGTGKEVWADCCLHNFNRGFWSHADGMSAYRKGWRSDYVAANGGTTSAAQTALLGKVEDAAAIADGLIFPDAPHEITDPIDTSVTLEPAGWWDSMTATYTVQFAAD